MTEMTPEIIAAAQAADFAGRDPHGFWTRVPDSQVARLIRGAQPLMGMTDQQIIDHPGFERAIRRMLRANSPEFAAWAERQNRINGNVQRWATR